MVPSELFLPYPSMQYISHRNLLLSENSNWANLKKKIFKILAYIHLLCRFLVASWEEQFACQIITKNPLHLLLSVSHGSEVKLSNTSLICWTKTQLGKKCSNFVKHLNSLIKFLLNQFFYWKKKELFQKLKCIIE